MRRIVIKLSGHIFDREELVVEYIERLREILLADSSLSLVIVTGGGSTARRYVNLIRKLSSNESLADIVGIMCSRLNAYLLIGGLGDLAYPVVPENVQQFMQALASGKRAVVVGGLQPGQSTATVAVLLAELSGSRELIYCANVDAVYTDDPRKNPSAQRLSRVSVSELLEILKRSSDIRAGTYQLIDQWALLIAKRAGIRIYVVDGSKPDLLVKVVEKQEGYGTVIIPE